MSISENIKICKENQTILAQNSYEVSGRQVALPNSPAMHQKVMVLDPRFVKASLDSEFDYNAMGIISVANEDSFASPSQLVLNFANAYHPGGGYLQGSVSQEECLCRQSTLYASLTAPQAARMYEANKAESSLFNTDYMLVSPCVDVFRSADLQLLKQPLTTAVITAAAPDLRSAGGQGVTQQQVDDAMLDKIRKLLSCAAALGYRYITLGAWGCGVFCHDAARVSGYFRTVLIEEGYRFLFDGITFAVLDKSTDQYNFRSFAETFFDCV
ncbi:MAG: TIGR02452 family protein [Firmicutes bacterium]|nr:TIGR02452 family protein [Bacillota bacterium]